MKSIPYHPKGIVIAIHGFTSCKESSTYRLLIERLPEAGFGMVPILSGCTSAPLRDVPQLEMYMIWRKYQTFTPIADLLMNMLRSRFQ